MCRIIWWDCGRWCRTLIGSGPLDHGSSSVFGSVAKMIRGRNRILLSWSLPGAGQNDRWCQLRSSFCSKAAADFPAPPSPKNSDSTADTSSLRSISRFSLAPPPPPPPLLLPPPPSRLPKAVPRRHRGSRRRLRWWCTLAWERLDYSRKTLLLFWRKRKAGP